MEVVLHPKQIIDIVSETATLVKFGEDCTVMDWKTSTKDIVKPTTTWNIQFNQCKRFILRRSKKPGNVLVRGEIYYKSDLATAQNICRPRKLINMINPIILPRIVAVNKNKLSDVNKLLSKHFGAEWKGLSELIFYKELLLRQDALHETPSEDTYCDEQVQESDELRI